MRLPIPIFHNDNIYTDAEIKKPKASVLANVSSSIQSERINAGLLIFLKGSVVSISNDDQTIEDPIKIKSILTKIPYRTAEYLSIQTMIKQYNGQDGVEGIYPCPLCGHKIICQLQYVDDIEIDTRDFISQLKVNCQNESEYHNFFSIELAEPVIIKNARDGTAIEEVFNLEMYYPTMEHCMNAEIKTGHKNDLKLQFGIYANALKSINGQDVDKKYINMVGTAIFENIENLENDFKEISYKNSLYGIDTRVEKQCPECSKVWQPKVNTSNFFASALRLN